MASSPSQASSVNRINWFSSGLNSWRAAVTTVSREIIIEVKGSVAIERARRIVETGDEECVGENSVHFSS